MRGTAAARPGATTELAWACEAKSSGETRNPSGRQTATTGGKVMEESPTEGPNLANCNLAHARLAAPKGQTPATRHTPRSVKRVKRGQRP